LCSVMTGNRISSFSPQLISYWERMVASLVVSNRHREVCSFQAILFFCSTGLEFLIITWPCHVDYNSNFLLFPVQTQPLYMTYT
jgi:hypothetical protein